MRLDLAIEALEDRVRRQRSRRIVRLKENVNAGEDWKKEMYLNDVRIRWNEILQFFGLSPENGMDIGDFATSGLKDSGSVFVNENCDDDSVGRTGIRVESRRGGCDGEFEALDKEANVGLGPTSLEEENEVGGRTGEDKVASKEVRARDWEKEEKRRVSSESARI